ncbi:Meiotic recombination protein rec8 [Aphelenchoides fujianensis]|nr:Meiotic recombination protein rec8 [Aphelenchoides fujianensis]
MFYSFQLLIKTGGEFAVIWKLAHDGLKKVSRDDVLAIDIRSKCEALERYLPTGQFSAAEVKNKMSLYLLAVLQYGIVVAHARKTDFVLRDLKAAFAIMKPSFAKEQRAQKRTSNVEAPVRRKKPRKSTALQPIAEEAEDEEEDVNMSMAVDQLPDGRPSPYVRDLREITMQEVDDRPLHDFGFEHPNIDDYLNMMELQSNHGSEHSRDAFTSQRPSDLPPDLQVLYDQLEAENDFTMATLDPRMEHREVDLTTTVHDLGMDGQPSMVEDGLHVGDEPMQLDVGEQMPVDPELDPESQLNDSFHLPTLTEEELQQAEADARATAAANRRPRRQRQKRLIVDEQVEMTDVSSALPFCSNPRFLAFSWRSAATCSSRRTSAWSGRPPAFKAPPGLAELFGPFPCYIPFGQDELRSIFEAATEMALENVRGRQAEEEEAEQSQLELEQPAVPDFFEQPMPAEVTDGFPEAERELSAEEIARRSGVDFVPAHEQPSLDAHGPSLPFVPELVTHPDPELAEAYEVVNITHRSPSPPTEMDAAAENLLQRIQRKKGAGPSVAFHSVCGKTKSRGARDFVNLLFLLKRRLVTAQQAKPFGPILVQ